MCGALGAVLRVDHRRADASFLRELLEHEQELAVGARQLARERPLGLIEDALDDLAVARQVDRVEVLGDREHLLHIFPRRLANPKYGRGTVSLRRRRCDTNHSESQASNRLRTARDIADPRRMVGGFACIVNCGPTTSQFDAVTA